MSELNGKSDFDYNLRWWVSSLQVILFLSPFIVLTFIEADGLEYFRFGYWPEIIACSLLFVSSLLIGTIPRLAKVCAKDPSRVERTMKSSLNAAVISSVALLLAGGFFLWDYLSS